MSGNVRKTFKFYLLIRTLYSIDIFYSNTKTDMRELGEWISFLNEWTYDEREIGDSRFRN